jgi:hypothetical protein
MKLITEKQTLQLEYNEIKREKDILSSEHRIVIENMREDNRLALQQIQD